MKAFWRERVRAANAFVELVQVAVCDTTAREPIAKLRNCKLLRCAVMSRIMQRTGTLTAGACYGTNSGEMLATTLRNSKLHNAGIGSLLCKQGSPTRVRGSFA